MIWARPLRVGQVLDKFLERANCELVIVENDIETLIAEGFCLEKKFPDQFKRSFVDNPFSWIDTS